MTKSHGDNLITRPPLAAWPARRLCVALELLFCGFATQVDDCFFLLLRFFPFCAFIFAPTFAANCFFHDHCWSPSDVVWPPSLIAYSQGHTFVQSRHLVRCSSSRNHDPAHISRYVVIHSGVIDSIFTFISRRHKRWPISRSTRYAA